MKKLLYFFNKNKILFKNFFWRSSQTLLKSVLSISILLISLSYLTSVEYGIITYISSIMMLFIIVCDFGISASASKYTAEYSALQSDNEKKVFGSASVIIIILATISSLFIIIFGSKLFHNYYKYILVLIPNLYITPFISLLDGIYRGKKKFKDLFFRNIYACGFAIGISFILIMKYKLFGAVLSVAAIQFIYLIGLLFSAPISTRGFNSDVMRKIAKYAMYIGIANVSYFMYTRIDILIMEKFGYMVEIGYYGIIDNIFNFILMPSIILGQTIAPDASRWSSMKEYNKLREKFRLSAIYGLPLSIVTAILIYIFFIVILNQWGSKYNDESFIQILKILSFLLPLKIWGSFTANAFITPSGYAKILSVLTFLGGLSNIILDLVLIKYYGFVGVFLATLIVHSICISLSNFIYFKKLNIRSKELKNDRKTLL